MHSAEQALKLTIQSYNRTAASYAERTHHSQMYRQRDWFIEFLPVQNAHILDLGCGPGWDTLYFRGRGYHVTGVDLSSGMLEEARQRVPGNAFVQADMRRLPLQSGSFGAVWACASLLHLPKESAMLALAEIARVLAPGGLLFLAVKQGEAESWREPADAVNRFYFAYYLSEELADLTGQVRFEILSLAENHSRVQFHPDGSPVRWINLFARKVDR